MNFNRQTYYFNLLKVCLAVERKNDLLNNLKLESFATNKEMLNLYVDCVSDVFCKYGLKEDDEPNASGLIFEDLIDYLNNYIYELEDGSKVYIKLP